jgi:hypothetical protein
MGEHKCLITTKKVTIEGRTGGWDYAAKSLLEPYGLRRDNGRHQYLLLEWMKGHNRGKIGTDDYLLLTDGKVEMEVPADRCSVMRIIGERITGDVGACHETQYIDTSWCMLSEPKWLDGEGNETEKGTAGKAVTLSMKYKSNKAEDKITFRIYQEGSGKEVGKMEVPVAGEEDKKSRAVQVEWVYDYEEVRRKEGEQEPYREKPKYYFTAVNEDGYTLQHDKLLEMGMEIHLVVVDDDSVIIRNAPIEVKFKAEQKDGQGNPLDNPLQGKSDADGAFKKTDLIPDETEVTVNMPIERSYPLDSSSGELTIYPNGTSPSNNNDHTVQLEQIDGSEIIQNGSCGQNPIPPDKLDLGKTNIIKLPVRYLEKTLNKNRELYLPNGQGPYSEVDFVEEVIGSNYSNTPVEIKKIQIFVKPSGAQQSAGTQQPAGLPSPKYMQDVLNYYYTSQNTLQIKDNASAPHNGNDQLHQDLFDEFKQNEIVLGKILGFSSGMSLPNKIIFVDLTKRTLTEGKNALFIHEVFHQFQYALHREEPTFTKLIQEMWDGLRGADQIQNLARQIQSIDPNLLSQLPQADSMGGYDPYAYNRHANLSNNTNQANITNLQQIQTFEGQAQFVEEFTILAYDANYSSTYNTNSMGFSDYNNAVTASGIQSQL